MICALFGHRDILEDIEPLIENAVIKMIADGIYIIRRNAERGGNKESKRTPRRVSFCGRAIYARKGEIT